jgi:hypothetical protein
MPAHNAAALHERRRPRRETRQAYDNDEPFHRWRFLGIGRETSPMARVPALTWPADLFVDVFVAEVESASCR